jgi:hypothetical protein
VRRREQLLAFARVDAHEQPALAGGRDRHVPREQERQAAEHRHLGHVLLIREQLANAMGQFLVVCHFGDATAERLAVALAT